MKTLWNTEVDVMGRGYFSLNCLTYSPPIKPQPVLVKAERCGEQRVNTLHQTVNYRLEPPCRCGLLKPY